MPPHIIYNLSEMIKSVNNIIYFNVSTDELGIITYIFSYMNK